MNSPKRKKTGFYEHISAGFLAASIVFCLSLFFKVNVFIFWTVLLFSVFPDLDTNSIIQRWYFRVLFFLVLILFYNNMTELATFLSLISFLPMFDHHRGWTHRIWSPFAYIFAIIVLYNLVVLDSGLVGINYVSFVGDYADIWISLVVGWHVHLYIDS